ncbi:hypothetical protein PV08_08825 [Exophiala spinifera]|uniref:RWD domain-containing protein n=1 Tax=Exophiala spinifera TaxID=91928 RepID=A0A0D2BR10_9EURO|nr:uncharacterized protein PV08_08825 [Exophiala spinifera]KIW13634.1 hypothetical protein PV08_08825 [Exophiala spinifera]
MSEPEKAVSNAALADEVEALNSIYGPNTLVVRGDSSSSASTTSTLDTTTAVLQLPDLPFSFLVSFPTDYPANAPPTIVGTQSTGGSGRGEGEAAVTILRDVLGRVWVPDQVCLFDLLEEAGPLLQQEQHHNHNNHHHHHHHGAAEDHTADVAKRSAAASASAAPPPPPPTAVSATAAGRDHYHSYERDDLTRDTAAAAAASSGVPAPAWVVSEPLTVNRSTFVARACRATALSAATDSISHLLATNKKVAGATHNITAWRIRGARNAQTGAATAVQDCDDDGETAAGGRLLHLMQLMDVWDVVVVVTRWYGGVKLGPDRFRLINSVAREVLVKGGFDAKGETESDRHPGKAGKGKGKK